MAGATPLAPARRAPTATASAREWRSAPPPRWSPSRSAGRSAAHPTPTRGTRSGRCGRCWRCSTRPRRSRGAPRSHAHRDRRHALARRHGGAVRQPTPPTGPSCCGPGGRASAGASTRIWRGSPSCGGGCAPGSAAPDPTERVDAACAALRADPAVVALPERLSLFGPTRLAAQELAVLAALGEHRAVHLWLPHPSPALWATVTYPVGRGAAARRRPDRRRGRAPAAVLARARRAGAAGAAHRRRARPRRSSTTRAPSRRPRCWAGCSGSCATTVRR